MTQRTWIALAAALGIALAGCSSMRSGNNDQGSSTGTMRRADSGSTSGSSSTSSPSSTTSPGTRSTPDSGSSADCSPDAAGKTPAGCAGGSTQPDSTSPDTTTPNTTTPNTAPPTDTTPR